MAVVSLDEPDVLRLAGERFGSLPNFTDLAFRLMARGGRLARIAGNEARDELAKALDMADIVHIHSVWEPLVRSAARCARDKGIPYGITPHGMLTAWALGQKRFKKRIAMVGGYRSMLNHAGFIHAIGLVEAEGTRQVGLRAPIYMIPLGIRAEEFTPYPPSGEFRDAHSSLRGRKYILFLSRLHPGKGLDVLASAFAMLAKTHPAIMLVIVGPDAGARESFDRQVSAAGIQDRVLLTGPLYGRAKAAALRDAECFCLPSEHEACSVAILEALMCGVPVVISPECDRPEVTETGAGIIVARDPRLLADALDSIVANPAVKARMGDAARNLARSRFTWDRVTSELDTMYRTAIDRQGHRRGGVPKS